MNAVTAKCAVEIILWGYIFRTEYHFADRMGLS